ncbi:MAG TPA: hypothetical protein VIG31_06395 [Rhodanobacteraceae bacterium]|jgi:hypothetical protein
MAATGICQRQREDWNAHSCCRSTRNRQPDALPSGAGVMGP